MAVDARIRELGNRHRNLDQAIQKELRSPSTDSLQVREMKRQKLRLKEEMEQLRGGAPV